MYYLTHITPSLIVTSDKKISSLPNVALRSLRPSHATTETTQKVVIVHTHYNLFHNCKDFLNSFIYRCENCCSVQGPLQ